MPLHRRPLPSLFATWACLLMLAAGSAACAQPPAPPPNDTGIDLNVPVQALLASNPTTPPECAKAASLLADFNQPRLARDFLKRILDANPDEATLAGLAEQFGTGMFTEMARNKLLQPEARQLADMVMKAAKARLQDVNRVEAMFKELRSPSELKRQEAAKFFREAGGAAVGPMVHILAEPGRSDDHALAREVLVALGSDAVDPLISTLENADPLLMPQAIDVLVQLRAKRAAIYLLGPATAEKVDPKVRAAARRALKILMGVEPDKKEAVEVLVTRARGYFDRKQPLENVANHKVTIWTWDVAKKQAVAAEYAEDEASRFFAARLARDAYAVAPDNAEVRSLYLNTMLEEAAYRNGLDKPLEEGNVAVRMAKEFSPAVLEGTLESAMLSGHPAAATAIARILGATGATAQLLYPPPAMEMSMPRPLVMALKQPDRRLRLAAAEAIVRLQPLSPYSGSSLLPETLAFFAASDGRPKALLASPTTESMRELSGMLAAKGMESETAVNGRTAVRMAAASPEYELALIDVYIEGPAIDETLQALRRDPRTTDLRIGLIARSGAFELAKRVERRDGRAMWFPKAHDDASFQWQLDQLATIKPREFVGRDERRAQTELAMRLLAEIASNSRALYDLQRVQDVVLVALYNKEVTEPATRVLAVIGTPESQRALVELASRNAQPLHARQAALRAFRESTQRYGILLTTVEIQRQYARYNQSATEEPATQRVLALILDCLEAPTQSLKPKTDKTEKSDKK